MCFGGCTHTCNPRSFSPSLLLSLFLFFSSLLFFFSHPFRSSSSSPTRAAHHLGQSAGTRRRVVALENQQVSERWTAKAGTKRRGRERERGRAIQSSHVYYSCNYSSHVYYSCANIGYHTHTHIHKHKHTAPLRLTAKRLKFATCCGFTSTPRTPSPTWVVCLVSWTRPTSSKGDGEKTFRGTGGMQRASSTREACLDVLYTVLYTVCVCFDLVCVVEWEKMAL